MKTLTRTTTTSMNASFNEAAIHLENLEGFSIVAVWTESVAVLGGTLKLQASNNAFLQEGWNNVENSSATWVDISGSSVTVSGAGSQCWNVSDVYYSAARVVWTRTGGEGSLTTYTYAKGIT